MLAPYLGSILRRGGKQLRRQVLTQTVATLTMAVALALAGAAHGLLLQLDELAGRLHQELRLIVFLKPASVGSQADLADRIAALPVVQGVISLTSSEAKEKLKAILGHPDLMEGLGPEVIPPVLEVQVRPEGLKPEALEQLRGELAAMPGVDEATFAQDVAERLGGLVDRLKGLGRGLSGALVLASMFIIFATIRLALLAHQEEIQILKIIGASGWFVRGPYLVQGAGQGLVAAILALALLVGLQVWLNLGFEAALSQEMAGLNLQLNFLGPGLALELLAAGGLAGLTGAGLALGRVMRE